jgi:hypothetical protein
MEWHPAEGWGLTVALLIAEYAAFGDICKRLNGLSALARNGKYLNAPRERAKIR